MEKTFILTLMALIMVSISVAWMAARVFGTLVMQTSYELGRDAQLKQVMEWLKTNTEDYVLEDYYSTYFLIESFLDDFKKAMRPATTQEEN